MQVQFLCLRWAPKETLLVNDFIQVFRVMSFGAIHRCANSGINLAFSMPNTDTELHMSEHQ